MRTALADPNMKSRRAPNSNLTLTETHIAPHAMRQSRTLGKLVILKKEGSLNDWLPQKKIICSANLAVLKPFALAKTKFF